MDYANVLRMHGLEKARTLRKELLKLFRFFYLVGLSPYDHA